MRKIVAPITLVLLIFPACTSAPETTSDGTEVLSEPSSSRPAGGGGSRGSGGANGWTGPDLTVTTFDGDTFSLAEYAGTPVVLNFWESW